MQVALEEALSSQRQKGKLHGLGKGAGDRDILSIDDLVLIGLD